MSPPPLKTSTLSFQGGGKALVYEVAPKTAFGFGKGEGRFSQTRWRFEAG